MEQKHQDLLTNNCVYLTDYLDVRLIIPHMMETELLDDDDKERLEVS